MDPLGSADVSETQYPQQASDDDEREWIRICIDRSVLVIQH